MIYDLGPDGSVLRKAALLEGLAKVVRDHHARLSRTTVDVKAVGTFISVEPGRHLSNDGVIDLTVSLTQGKDQPLGTYGARLTVKREGLNLAWSLGTIMRSAE